MFLFFGTHTISVREYSFADLKIEDETGLHSIERRQRIFHVFFIPLFPISQTWLVKRRGDSNKYTLSAELASHIENMGLNTPAPWYCYIGLMLMGVLLLLTTFIR